MLPPGMGTRGSRACADAAASAAFVQRAGLLFEARTLVFTPLEARRAGNAPPRSILVYMFESENCYVRRVFSESRYLSGGILTDNVSASAHWQRSSGAMVVSRLVGALLHEQS